MAFIHSKPEYTIDSVHDDIEHIVNHERSGGSDGSTDFMDIFNKMPRFLSKFIIHVIMLLDKKGICPAALVESDPYYSSVVLTSEK